MCTLVRLEVVGQADADLELFVFEATLCSRFRTGENQDERSAALLCSLVFEVALISPRQVDTKEQSECSETSLADPAGSDFAAADVRYPVLVASVVERTSHS